MLHHAMPFTHLHDFPVNVSSPNNHQMVSKIKERRDRSHDGSRLKGRRYAME